MTTGMEGDGKLALVTGANKGIGFEIARGLARRGVAVLLGARDAGRGDAAAAKLRAEGLDATAILLDVADPVSVGRAAELVSTRFGRLDILVNNAGINLESTAGLTPLTTPLATVEETFRTNVFGPVAMIEAFLPLLRKSAAGRIVNLTSELGSLTQTSDPQCFHYPFGTLGYAPSKSALNAITVSLSKALADTPIKVNCVCPGLTATDLSGNFGDRTAAQGARIAIEMSLIGRDGPTGGYFNDAGRLPW